MHKKFGKSTHSFFLSIIVVLVVSSTVFAQPCRTLTVQIEGQGTVELDPTAPDNCYPRGTEVTLTAVPADGWVFSNWWGNPIHESTNNPEYLTMNKGYTVKAIFAEGGENIRQRAGIIKVVDNQQQPVENVDVQIDMTDRAFPFGVCVTSYLNSNPEYQNFVWKKTPLWWDWAVYGNESKWYANEPFRDMETYEVADNMADILTSWNFNIRGHCLYWAVQANNSQWVQDLQWPEELQAEVEERMNSAVPHYAGTFLHWDVNNEMVHGSFFEQRLGSYIRPWMHNRTVELDPDVLTCVNDYNVISGGWELDEFIALVQDLASQGAHIDTVGVQCHLGQDTSQQIKDRLDSVATLGYPIWCTEFDIADADENARASKVENFYRTAFGHPAVAGIMAWSWWENDSYRGPEGAWVNADWTLNAAGQKYESLMNEWWTNASGTSDQNGEVDWTGYLGDYRITLTPGGQDPEEHYITLEEGNDVQLFTLDLGTGSPPDTSAPSPDPMTWASAPAPSGNLAVSMTATTASDDSGVEYYFANLTDPSRDSGWWHSPTYVDSDLEQGVEYTYQVKARDRSPAQNETQWSSPASATAEYGNVLTNPGFEMGTAYGWWGFAWALTEASTAQKYSGSFSGYTTTRDYTYAGPAQSMEDKMEDGATYECSVWVRLDNAASDYVTMTMQQDDGAGANYYQIASATAYNDQWVQLTGSFTLNITGTLNELTLYISGPAVGVNFYIDDASVVKTGGPEPVDMYVNDITMTPGNNGPNYYVDATVWIKDANGVDVAGATVYGDWSGCVTGSSSGDTGSDGKVTLQSSKKRNGGLFEFCLTDVTATDYSYKPSLNNETCDQIQAP
jgi:GH35 family endo-1,4-beta-xylanase